MQTSTATPTGPCAARKRLPIVTNSELRTFRRCTLEHHYAYRLGYRPRERAEALDFGTLVHAALEAWWRAYAADPSTRLEAALAALDGHGLGLGNTDVEQYARARAEALILGYDARWAGVEAFEVVAVEVEFRTSLVNPLTQGVSRTFDIAGKLDALVRSHDDGGVYIVEHKTSSEDIGPGSHYWKRLQLDSQISMYFAGARALGYDPRGCLYDVVGKPGLKPLKATPVESRKYTKAGALYANQRDTDELVDDYFERVAAAITETPERYYQRGVVVRLPEEERDAAFDTWQTARAIRDAELAGLYPRNVASCERYSRMCPYFDVCTRSAGLEDQARFERLEHVHPELSQSV